MLGMGLIPRHAGALLHTSADYKTYDFQQRVYTGIGQVAQPLLVNRYSPLKSYAAAASRGSSALLLYRGQQSRKARRRSQHTCARASTETAQSTKTQEDDEDDEDIEIQIEGLTEDYCDDFVCTSSPAVEQTLRSLAKDLVRRRWTPFLFAKDVKYRDSYRRFSGAERHKRLLHISNSVRNAKVLVTRMQMLNKGSGTISWRLRGQLGALPLDIDFQSTFELDLITGRVREHVDSWDTSRCSLPAKLAWNASRAAWSFAETSKDLGEDAGKLLGRFKGDDDSGRQENIYADPSDPTKFFQQEDSTVKDLFSFALIAALLYLVASAYYQLEQIK